MSSILDSYEREFSGLMADIARRTTAIPDLTGDERKTDLRAAGKDVEDAKGAVCSGQHLFFILSGGSH